MTRVKFFVLIGSGFGFTLLYSTQDSKIWLQKNKTIAKGQNLILNVRLNDEVGRAEMNSSKLQNKILLPHPEKSGQAVREKDDKEQ